METLGPRHVKARSPRPPEPWLSAKRCHRRFSTETLTPCEAVSPTGWESSFCQEQVPFLMAVYIYQAHRRLLFRSEYQFIKVQWKIQLSQDRKGLCWSNHSLFSPEAYLQSPFIIRKFPGELRISARGAVQCTCKSHAGLLDHSQALKGNVIMYPWIHFSVHSEL